MGRFEAESARARKRPQAKSHVFEGGHVADCFEHGLARPRAVSSATMTVLTRPSRPSAFWRVCRGTNTARTSRWRGSRAKSPAGRASGSHGPRREAATRLVAPAEEAAARDLRGGREFHQQAVLLGLQLRAQGFACSTARPMRPVATTPWKAKKRASTP
jgi:hypothetical protein